MHLKPEERHSDRQREEFRTNALWNAQHDVSDSRSRLPSAPTHASQMQPSTAGDCTNRRCTRTKRTLPRGRELKNLFRSSESKKNGPHNVSHLHCVGVGISFSRPFFPTTIGSLKFPMIFFYPETKIPPIGFDLRNVFHTDRPHCPACFHIR